MDNPSQDIVEIALQSDRRFYPGLLVTACSMAEHASRHATLRFHILDGGVGDDNRKDLEATVKKLHPNVRLSWINFDAEKLTHLPEWRGSGKMCWARIWLPELLPNTDWVIYYDVDFICLGDVAELWKLRDRAIGLMSVPDNWPLSRKIEIPWFQKNNCTYNDASYFCSGFCFFNLKRIRDEHIDQKFKRIMLTNKSFPSPDQSVLNLAFADRDDLKILPRRWQRYTRDLIEDDFATRPMIHFAGEAPWVCFRRNKIFTDACLFWFRYYAKLNNLTLWQALRQFYSVAEIFIYRTTYCVFSRSRMFRSLLHAYFRMIKHRESIIIYDALLHRITYPNSKS